MNHSKRVKIAWTAIIICAVILAPALFLLLRPYNNVVVEPSTVSVTKVEAGGFVEVATPICVWGVGRIDITRKLIGKFGASILPAREVFPQHPNEYRCVVNKSPVEIPPETVPGEYRYELELTYQANLIRTITVETITNPFTVIKSSTPLTPTD